MKDVIRLSQCETKWIERYRKLRIAEARLRIEEGFKSGEFDLKNYTECSDRELIEDMLLEAVLDFEKICKDLKIEV